MRWLLIVLVSVLPAFAADESGPARRTIVLENEAIVPTRITVRQGELVAFQNRSSHPVSIAFVEPPGLRDRAPRLLERPGTPTAGAPVLFRWDRGQLTAVLPPGGPVLLGPLPPGRYVYTVALENPRARGEESGGALPEKGEIEVSAR
ncbi:MAG TPA: hypothetical protein VKA21_09480 [Candidatus Binatia bacterium]|nr:hypothetical protein [Candidatus Binatia bacterium]